MVYYLSIQQHSTDMAIADLKNMQSQMLFYDLVAFACSKTTDYDNKLL